LASLTAIAPPMQAFGQRTAGQLDKNRIAHQQEITFALPFVIFGGRASVAFRRGRACAGYFAVGVDGISKPMKSRQSFAHRPMRLREFLLYCGGPGQARRRDVRHLGRRRYLPLYQFNSVDEFRLPQGCTLVGVEITDEAVALPSFRHPLRAAYVFGAERLVALARDARTVRPCGENSDPVFDQCRHGGRNRSV